MTKEDLERLYMDIYDNGIPDYGYKEKFKRYVNNRFESLEKENKDLRDNYEQYKAVAEPEIDVLKNEIVNLKGVIESLSEQRDRLNKEHSRLESRIQYWTSEYYKLENFMNNKLAKAKEIINNLMVLAVMDFREYEEAYKEAEQFLKG